jgi:hypothetical protein
MTDYLIRLSQTQLNLLENCPPHFQRIYLEQLNSPLSPQQQEKQTWGSQFHLLMQQKELGLPIEPLIAEDEQLSRCISALAIAASEIWHPNRQAWREAEHCRTLSFQGYLLTVVYDLLVGDRATAQILDWKTYLVPENQAKLAKNWQTRLYLYVLAETSAYLPEDISMTYWFVRHPTQPQSLTFTYNSFQHEKTRQDLNLLLTQLDTWLKNYAQDRTPFPHLSNCQESCPYYQSLLAFSASFSEERKIRKDRLELVKEVAEVSI